MLSGNRFPLNFNQEMQCQDMPINRKLLQPEKVESATVDRWKTATDDVTHKSVKRN